MRHGVVRKDNGGSSSSPLPRRRYAPEAQSSTQEIDISRLSLKTGPSQGQYRNDSSRARLGPTPVHSPTPLSPTKRPITPLDMPSIFRTPPSIAPAPRKERIEVQHSQRSGSVPRRRPPDSPTKAPREQDVSHAETLPPSIPELRPDDSLPSAGKQARQSPVASLPPQVPSTPSSVPVVPADEVSPADPLPPLIKGKLDLPQVVVCHCQLAQRRMEAKKIAWGVQYELARGVLAGLWTWDDVDESALSRLQGCNAVAAPKVMTVMADVMKSKGIVQPRGLSSSMDLWKEYDREQDAIVERQLRGLGLKGEWKGVADWYGGRIQQTVRVTKSGAAYSYLLDPPDMRKSNRFSRYLGSRRVLKMKLSPELQYNSDVVLEHLSSRFVLCGRVFVPFASKEGNIHMMEVNEDLHRNPDRSQGDDTRISLWDFVEWHNPLSMNQKQPISKWSTRFDLGLSTSVPVLRFEPGNIRFVKDIEAPHEPGTKVPAEKILTDGCGFINAAALTLIAQRLGLSSRPTAVQGRIAGSKGLWVLHPEDRLTTEPPRIWIRESQRKIKLAAFDPDSVHTIFDLVAQSNHITAPSRLSQQLIINLAENGVPTDVLKTLLEDGLRECFAALTQWDGAEAMPLLWNAVNEAGNVSKQRLQRVARGLARAIGLAGRHGADRLDTELDQENVEEGGQGSEKSLHQTVLEMIQAGFNPKKSTYLYWKMNVVVKQAMEFYLKKYHIEVPGTAEAFIVPDPFGVLEEHQIHFKASQELKDPITETNPCSISGPVLVSRNPARVASDVQKVQAVEHKALEDYVNVIVFPIKGSRSLASFLGGGDYDGDTVMVNWETSIVNGFKQPRTIDKPDDLEDKNFEKMVEDVKSFHNRLSTSTSREVHQSFLRVLLRGLGNGKIGRYSKFHDYATYVMGYSHVETIRLAYMFTTCLDSSKTGLRILQDVFSKDGKRYGMARPVCMRDADDDGGEFSTNTVAKRDGNLKPFIIELLREFGATLLDEHLRKYEEISRQFGPEARSRDPHLEAPYKEIADKLSKGTSLVSGAGALLQEAAKELGTLRKHVDAIKVQWGRSFSSGPSQKRGKQSKWGGVDALQREFAATLDLPHLSLLGDISAIRASYAYTQCSPDNARFAFALAFEDLCNIKARALGGYTLAPDFAELMAISRPAVRTLSALRAAGQ
ncbi:RNA dependent RNA polymerase-domain-containing protein [Gloeopeniophorella convolvens]|nr:RNA dependent RNA polymerase-domain-containing protein [Gloeopeniophorella convolvens]